LALVALAFVVAPLRDFHRTYATPENAEFPASSSAVPTHVVSSWHWPFAGCATPRSSPSTNSELPARVGPALTTPSASLVTFIAT
jgi:hypothetical protein